MKTNYRNLRVQPQDMIIGKAFKKGLIKISPEVNVCSGYIPLWSWSRNQVGPIGCKKIKENCFILPITGTSGLRTILSGIRAKKPLTEFQFEDKTGAVQMRPIDEISERDLLNVLRNLSWIITETVDLQRTYRFDTAGQKYIVLRTDQLALGTRFSKRKLSRVLADYIRNIIKSGEADRELSKQLIREHRVSKADLESFSIAALAIKLAKGQARKILIEDLNSAYKQFCTDRKTSLRKGAKEIMIATLAAVPEGRLREEIRAAIVQIVQHWAIGYYIHGATNNLAGETIIKKLQEDHGLTEDDINTLTSQAEHQLTFPSRPDLLPEMIADLLHRRTK